MSEQLHWQQTIQQAFDQTDIKCVIKLFDQLSSKEKSQCDVAIVANPDVDELAQLENLIWVHSVWAGVDGMLAALANKEKSAKADYEIVRLIDPSLADTMSEAVLAWSLYLHREMPRYQQLQQQKIWQQQAYKTAQERTVGILGLGRLGQRSAERLLSNGFNVIGWSRRQKTISGVQTFAGEEGLTSLLEQSDIVVNLLPLTPETEGLLNKKRFDFFKAQAALINFGRGGTQVDADLLAALDQGLLSHAVLDVFSQEPLPEEHSYWSHEKVTVLPHISAPTSAFSASQIVVENIKQYLLTGVLPQTVDRKKGY